MGYEDLFDPKNVLALAKLTDEAQKSYFEKNSTFDPCLFEDHRKMIYEEKIRLFEGIQ